jgi:Phage tail tube protein
MAVVNGNDIGVYVGGLLIGCLTGSTHTSNREEIDVTCKDSSGSKQVLPGGLTSTVTFEGLWNPSGSYNFGDLLDVHLAGTLVNIKMGDNTYLTVFAQAYLNQIEWSAPLNGPTTCSGTFTVNGAWTKSET